MTRITYKEILLRELAQRRQRNPNYSLRAYARDLAMPAPKLSEALRGLKGISSKRAFEIADRLRFSLEEKNAFVDLVERDHAKSKIVRQQAEERLAKATKICGFHEIDLDRFQLISDWYHFAILELTDVSDFCSDPQWIAARLGIDVAKVKQAVRRLVSLGLLARSKDGKLKQTQADLATPSEVPSSAVRSQHSQLLQKAQEALFEQPVSARDFSAVTMAISARDIPKAKTLIKEFRRRLNRELQSSREKDRVYGFCVQFFSLEKKK